MKIEKLNKDLLTVGVFSCNQAKYLNDALNSLNHQKDVIFKVLIFDDASTDNSQSLIRNFKFTNEGITQHNYFLSEHNQGFANQLNNFLHLCNSEWVLILAADDKLDSNGLKNLISEIETNTDIVWGNLEIMLADGTPTGILRPIDTWQKFIAFKFRNQKIPKNSLIWWNNFIPGGMTLINKQFLKNSNGWYNDIRTEDYALWLKSRDKLNIKFINKRVGYYRSVDGSESKKHVENLIDQAEMVRKLEKDGKLNDFEGALILSLRLIYTIFKTKRISIKLLKKVSKNSEINLAIILIVVPISMIAPIFGYLNVGLIKIWQEVKA